MTFSRQPEEEEFETLSYGATARLHFHRTSNIFGVYDSAPQRELTATFSNSPNSSEGLKLEPWSDLVPPGEFDLRKKSKKSKKKKKKRQSGKVVRQLTFFCFPSLPRRSWCILIPPPPSPDQIPRRLSGGVLAALPGRAALHGWWNAKERPPRKKRRPLLSEHRCRNFSIVR